MSVTQPDEAARRTRVLVVRHGESESNVAGIWITEPTGNPLTDAGLAQARAAGERLADEGITVVYGSPIVRADQTAAEIAAVLDVEHRPLPGTQEMHLGIYEGAHESVVLPVAVQKFQSWLVEGNLEDAYEGGESGRDVAERLQVALDGVASRHEGETVAVVSHGGTMLVGLGVLCDNLPGELSIEQRILGNTSVVELERVDGRWACLSWAGIPVTVALPTTGGSP